MKWIFLLIPSLFFGQFNPVFFYELGKQRINFNGGRIAIYNYQNNAVDSQNIFDGIVGSAVTFAAGVNGNCAVFDASTNTGITVADNNVFSFTNGANDLPFTFKLNFKQTSTSSNPFLFTKNDNTAGVNNEYRVDYVAGKVRIMLIDASGSRIGKTISSTLSLNTFYNLIITYDGSKTEAGIKIYIDGTLQSTASASSGTYLGMTNTTKNLVVGTSSNNSTGDRFIGSIDEFYVFNKVIDATEITFLQSNYY